MLLGDPRQADQRNTKLQLLHGHSSIFRSCRSRAKLLVLTCLCASVFYGPLSGTNERTRALDYMYRSGSDSERDASTRSQGNQNAWSWFQGDIDWRHKRLSLSLSLCLSTTTHESHSRTIYYPGQKKRTIIEIRGEKNAVPRVISCSIRRDQRRASPIRDCPRLLPCADRSWSSMISHVEQRSSRRESQGWFFFLARVVPGASVPGIINWTEVMLLRHTRTIADLVHAQ